jgi:hypothetical protein
MEELLKESSFNSDRRKSRPASPRVPDCAVRETSTYYKLKGLCRGATRFRKDGHWDSIKLTSEYDCGSGGAGAGAGDMMRASDGITVPFQYEMTKVGACGDCGYAHDLDDVELDKSDKGKIEAFLSRMPVTVTDFFPQPKLSVTRNPEPATAYDSFSNPIFGKEAVWKPTTPAYGASRRAPLSEKATQPFSAPLRTSCATSHVTHNRFPQYPVSLSPTGRFQTRLPETLTYTYQRLKHRCPCPRTSLD